MKRYVKYFLLSGAVLLAWVSPLKAHAQDISDIAETAKQITVRIEGATQGSGVLVKKEGNTYTVLTAWHVISSNQPGEDIDLVLNEGTTYTTSIINSEKINDVDLGLITFKSPEDYNVASSGGNPKILNAGQRVYVSGFALPTSAVPSPLLRFLDGNVIANATTYIPKGYQLLYSNKTLPGMSGGAVLNYAGELVGIHGQGETDVSLSMESGIAVKTGTNQAIPINYYLDHITNSISSNNLSPKTSDDYLALATSALDNKQFNLAAEYALKSSQVNPTFESYRIAALGLIFNKDYNSAQYALANAYKYVKRGSSDGLMLMFTLGVSLFNEKKYAQVIDLLEGQEFPTLLYLRGRAKYMLMDMKGAIQDFTKAEAQWKNNPELYYRRGHAYINEKNYVDALIDFERAKSLGYELSAVNDSIIWSRLGINDFRCDQKTYVMMKRMFLAGNTSVITRERIALLCPQYN